MIDVAIIGHGYWGPNLARCFAAENAAVRWICDVDPARLRAAACMHPQAKLTTSARDVFHDAGTDAVVVVTPLESHYRLGMEALRSGKHLLLEKPLAARSGQAARLCDEAAKRNLVLMVGHTFVYHPAVERIRAIIAAGELGEICYYDAVRINLGLVRQDVDVFWDLAIHDLSIIDRVLPYAPCAVSAHGISHFHGGRINTGYLTLRFAENLIAHVHSNWLAPVKTRRTLIGGSRKMIVLDELEPSEKIKIYDCGVTVADTAENIYKKLYDYRVGDMFAPYVELTEPLRREAAHFLKCIETKAAPTTDGAAGLKLVRILEAAEKSLRAGGRYVELHGS